MSTVLRYVSSQSREQINENYPSTLFSFFFEILISFTVFLKYFYDPEKRVTYEASKFVYISFFPTSSLQQ